MIGETIHGRYSIVRLIGAGAMGNVFEAKHTGTGRRVALKVITGDLSKHPVLVARFGREARAAGVIESQHIAQVLDVGEDGGRPFLVMELLEGEDLQQLFARIGPLPPNLAVCIAAQACLGLAKAHASGIVHRDIKPGNIFLAKRDGGERVVKLLDFGIAKLKMEEAQDVGAAGLTGTGALLGTPLYVSPEQARGDKEIDFRTDIWSLGVVLYTALTGKTPHYEIRATGALILAICGGPGRPLQELAPWVDPDIVAVVDRALAIRPADRFRTAEEMHRALRGVANGGATAIQATALLPMTEAERAFVALPATVRGSEVPSMPDISEGERPRGPSEPAVVLTPPNADVQQISAHAATLSSADTVDAAIVERASPSTAPFQARTTGATSSPLGSRADVPRASRAPLLVVGAAVLGLAAVGIGRLASRPPPSSPPGAAEGAVQAAREGMPSAVVAPASSPIFVAPNGSAASPPSATSAAPVLAMPGSASAKAPVSPPRGATRGDATGK